MKIQQLRTLLNYSRQIKGKVKVLAAELLTSATDSFSQQVTIDKGRNKGYMLDSQY